MSTSESQSRRSIAEGIAHPMMACHAMTQREWDALLRREHHKVRFATCHLRRPTRNVFVKDCARLAFSE